MSTGPTASGGGGGTASSYKYANLPDIDTSAPDVYETDPGANDDLPLRKSSGGDTSESESDDDDDQQRPSKKLGTTTTTASSSQDIISSSIRPSDAASRFANATEYIPDFSDRIRRKKRGPYPVIETETYQVGARADDESPIDRLRRLKYETMALEEQLASQADNKQSQDKDQVPVAQMLDQLKVLRRQLASLDAGADLPAANSNNVWKAETKQLIHKLSALSTPSTTDTPADGHASTAASAPQNSNLGSLDRRIAEMEEALGIKAAMLDESKPIPKPILPTLQRLERQLQLLSQPRHLDAISRRVKVLVTELDRVNEAKRKQETEGAGQSLDSTKLTQLYSVSTRLEPLLPLVPSLLTRLHTLSDLHASAAQFASTLNELEERQSTAEREEKESRQLLASIQQSLADNAQRVQANVESLETRLAQLSERVARLS